MMKPWEKSRRSEKACKIFVGKSQAKGEVRDLNADGQIILNMS
jgi:hypothetical protein